ncbi:MAG: immunoglobulin domain-containing protein [Phycisphaeraceae bacterium]|nr:immunoglobulin domain-containing protein [Phycisphaeraceae bacterium]
MNKVLGLILVVVLGLSPAGARGQTCETWYAGGEEMPGVGGSPVVIGGGSIFDLTVWDPDGSGPARSKLLACGTFGAAGSTQADRLAMWNGSHWAPIGLQTNYTQNAPTKMAVFNSEVIVAGDGVAGLPGQHIARWTGIAWEPLGTGVDSGVSAMIVYNGELVVGGSFTTAGGVTANRIARWNGSTWQPLGTGITSGTSVNHLAEFNGDLIVGGTFTAAGGVAVTNMARWNGSSWSSMNNTVSSTNGPFATLNGQLHAAGSGGVYRYTGTAWQQVVLAPTNGSIQCLAPFSDELYIGGSFDGFGSVQAFRIARWSSTNGLRHVISNSGAGTSGTSVRSLVVRGNELIAAGQMSQFGGVPGTENIGRWNGTTWLSTVEGVESGLNGLDSVVGSVGGLLALSGHFQKLGGVTFPGTAVSRNTAWLDGSPWASFGSGLTAALYSFETFNGEMVAGGSIISGGVIHSGVSRWDGLTWQGIGGSMNGLVRALAVFNGDLIAGGEFTSVGGTNMNRVARWNGSNWQPLGSGMNNPVLTLHVYNGELIAGGSFTTADGLTANRIARWNGSSWQPLSSGITGGSSPTVRALTTYNGNLIAGGNFTSAGGVSVLSAVAQWNGSTWQAVGVSSFTGGVRALAVWNGHLFAGGNFDLGSTSGLRFIARWNGSLWTPLGSGMNGTVTGMTVHNNQLFVTGEFSLAGGTVFSPRWAVYGLVPTVAPSIMVPPQAQEVGSGSVLTLNAFASPGIPGLRYQWYRNGIALINGWDGASPGGGFVTKSMGTVHDATRPILLVIKDCQPADAGMYHLRLTSPCGLSTDSPAVTVTILGDETCTPGCLP